MPVLLSLLAGNSVLVRVGGKSVIFHCEVSPSLSAGCSLAEWADKGVLFPSAGRSTTAGLIA